MTDIHKFKIIDRFLNAARESEEKDPQFCDKIVNTATSWEKIVPIMKSSELQPVYAENILFGKIASAMNNYKIGSKNQALKEFAESGAAIIRVMEIIETELEEQ